MIDILWLRPYALILTILVSTGMAIAAWMIGKNNYDRTTIEIENGSNIKPGDEIFIENKKAIVLEKKGNLLTVARLDV